MQIDFDPNVISFEEIAEVFWNNHNPLQPGISRQYMSAIWYHNEAQRETINNARDAVASKLSGKIQTPVLPLDVFYPAENYHQKYRLQQSASLMKHFARMYSDVSGFVDSTAAARMNGFLYGYGQRELFERESDSYGIPLEELNQVIRFREATEDPENCSSGRCSI